MSVMEQAEFDERIRKVLGNYMEIKEELKMDDRLDELGLDSFKAIYLLLDIEEEFKIQIPDHMLAPEIFSSPNALKEVVSAVLNSVS